MLLKKTKEQEERVREGEFPEGGCSVSEKVPETPQLSRAGSCRGIHAGSDWDIPASKRCVCKIQRQPECVPQQGA